MEQRVSHGAGDTARLKVNAIGPFGLAALAIGITSPAMGLYALWAPIQSAAGPISPLIFLAALAVMLPTAISYATLNRYAPSAGAASAWLWQAVSPAAGFLAGLVMMTYFLMVCISMPVLFALFFRDFLAWAGIAAPDVIALIIGILIETTIVTWICLRGAEASVRTTVVLMIAETVVVLALSATILAAKSSVPGGINLDAFSLDSATNGTSGVWAGLILGVLAYCGFDVVSTAAEEAQAPREYVPRAIMITVIGIALFWSANAWVLTLSTPHENVLQYMNEGLTAITPVAQTYWGIGNLAVILTAFTGLIAVYISCVQGASRVMFALARHRLLPRPLASLHGAKRVPHTAVVVVTFGSVILGLLSLYVLQQGLAVFVWWSNALVFFALLTFSAVNVANMVYFARVLPEKFGVLRNLIVPAIGLTSNLYLIYAAFFNALWAGPMVTSKSVVIACVVILIIQVLSVLAVMLLRPDLLRGGAPIGADTSSAGMGEV